MIVEMMSERVKLSVFDLGVWMSNKSLGIHLGDYD